MSAFNEVMTAEQEADKAIATAKEEVTAAIHTAESDGRNRLVTAEAEIKRSEQEERERHEQRIVEMVKKITGDAEAQVAAIKQRFTTQKTELTAFLKDHF
jgi:vacuolar-type H+-ATPase subunit H